MSSPLVCSVIPENLNFSAELLKKTELSAEPVRGYADSANELDLWCHPEKSIEVQFAYTVMAESSTACFTDNGSTNINSSPYLLATAYGAWYVCKGVYVLHLVRHQVVACSLVL